MQRYALLEHWDAVDRVYTAMLDLPEAERSGYLARLCVAQPHLADTLHALLDAHRRAGDFLEQECRIARQPLLDEFDSAQKDDSLEFVNLAGRRVGPCRLPRQTGHGGPGTANLVQLQRLLRAHEARGLLDVAGAPLPTAFRAGSAFRGTERFAVRRRLGVGGMGMVYEVDDRVRNEVVALKTLLYAGAEYIYRLKREFRSLADIAHPNLVTLYELVVEHGDCFFTMELVEGDDLVECLRRGSAADAPPNHDRVRRVLRQLVAGIRVLHQSGKLHRDIKPSNIMVTPQDRVVVLDFGLASDATPVERAAGEGRSGTPAYIAPERRAGAGPSESHDWYSVGVTLYQALTGQLPPDSVDAPEPRQLVAEIPDDLNAICAGLLRRDPSRRLAGEQVMANLDGRPGLTIEARTVSKEPDHEFVGRRQQLDALEAALAKVARGSATTVCVHGQSGIGKTMLVEHFLRLVSQREDVTILRGRCYERESVPYKAVDGVVDSLSQYLNALPPLQLATLLPAGLGALGRLFPVMLRVRTTGSRPQDDAGEDPVVLRLRAFEALGELLARIAARRPLVVFIDDLHWADTDSAVLLDALLRHPHAPPMLTIACFRSEEIESKPFLQALLDRDRANAGVSLSLDPMSKEEGQALLMSAMSVRPAVSVEGVTGLAAAAGGNPLLLRQIVDYLMTEHTAGRAVTFGDMLEHRLRALPAGGKRFLETLSICGRSMTPAVVYAAAGLAGDERPLVARLRAARFLRDSGSAQHIEVYHDHIRETLAASVSREDRRTLHRLLANTLLSRGADDPEALYEHYRGAGDDVQASVQAARAGEKAESALAFDRAVAYYRAALDLADGARAPRDWRERLARALANAGRPADAADAYLEAAADADPSRRLELQRLAAGQLLSGGHVDRGLEMLRTVLPAVGLQLARGPTGALMSMLWRRAQLHWRGTTCSEREADRVPAADLLRIDTCWSVAAGLAMVDHVHAAAFQARHVLLALDAGEPYRLARAFAAEVIYLGARGTWGGDKARVAMRRAEAQAARTHHPHAIALSVLARSAMAFLSGDWPAAQFHSDRAVTMLRNQPGATTWELNTAQIFHLGALLFQGELRAGARELTVLMDSARYRGNLYLETELRTRMNLLWLAADQPDQGIREAREAMRQWSHAGFHRQHYNFMLDQIQTELYSDRAIAAWNVIDEHWKAMKRTQLLRMQFARIEALYLRARCALAMAGVVHNPGRFVTVARSDARRLAREQTLWAGSLASLVSAGVVALDGRRDLACARLVEAAAGFDRAHMKLYAAVARRRLGELARDNDNRDHLRRADAWMVEQDIVNPSRITRMIAPGFPD